MKVRTSVVLAGLGMALASAAAEAAPIYADTLTTAQFVTSFGSGSVVGPPDDGGLFLGDTRDPPRNPGSLTVQFTDGLRDGPGADIFVVDLARSFAETAVVSVSADGAAFTFIGTIDAVDSSIDIAGRFAGPVSFVRVANSSRTRSMDVDAVGGFHPANVPEPSTLALLLAGLAAGWPMRRGARSRVAAPR